ncbi:hypothetical protein NDU88_005223 [Pleurodeles waltl]|uniref:Uncharacterized protein n=1 Tax=Pleurodeles waltl TaxID=8319 RepID=A0AAV7L3U9_PLEWA|nr:hypothetical protein NDU88_005223 [Pleurodeles waltl]
MGDRSGRMLAWLLQRERPIPIIQMPRVSSGEKMLGQLRVNSHLREHLRNIYATPRSTEKNSYPREDSTSFVITRTRTKSQTIPDIHLMNAKKLMKRADIQSSTTTLGKNIVANNTADKTAIDDFASVSDHTVDNNTVNYDTIGCFNDNVIFSTFQAINTVNGNDTIDDGSDD